MYEGVLLLWVVIAREGRNSNRACACMCHMRGNRGDRSSCASCKWRRVRGALLWSGRLLFQVESTVDVRRKIITPDAKEDEREKKGAQSRELRAAPTALCLHFCFRSFRIWALFSFLSSCSLSHALRLKTRYIAVGVARSLQPPEGEGLICPSALARLPQLQAARPRATREVTVIALHGVCQFCKQ